MINVAKFLVLHPRDKTAMLVVNTIEFFLKIEFSSQRREMLLSLTTNMAAVTSRATAAIRFWVTLKKSTFAEVVFLMEGGCRSRQGCRVRAFNAVLLFMYTVEDNLGYSMALQQRKGHEVSSQYPANPNDKRSSK